MSMNCEMRLLLVLYSAPRGFSPGSPVFPSPQKPTFPSISKFQFDPGMHGHVLNEFSRTPKCSVGKQITFTFNAWLLDETMGRSRLSVLCILGKM